MTDVYRQAIIRCVHRRADGTIVEETENMMDINNMENPKGSTRSMENAAAFDTE